MAYKLSGTILLITPTQTLPSRNGNSYQKRDLVITARKFDEYTGQPSEDSGNTPKFTFFGKQCESLDQFKPGDIVTISFDLSGRSYEKDGRTEYFTEVRPKFVDINRQGNQSGASSIQSYQEISQSPAMEQIRSAFPVEEQPATAEVAKDDLPF